MGEVNQHNVFDEIQSLCRDFRKRLKAGQSGSIAEYLPRIENAARDTLFQNLLHLDIEYRRKRGETPSSEDYVKRFPQYAAQIRQALFESTMMSQDVATPDSAEPTVTLGMPAARKLGEYELLRELGRGGFGVVYEARHLQRGDRLALKTLPTKQDGQSLSSRDADRLHRFRQEFRSLAEVNHPNLVGMQTLEVDGDCWFFTMDLIDGVDFLTYVRPRDNLDTDRLFRVLAQLVNGVIALHRRGIVHRDLKPSNVLVGRDAHLKILDFGLVTELQHLGGETLSVGTKHFTGTPRYAAPEQVSGERTAAVDWYAVGTMLFEAITGGTPVFGIGFEMMVKKQTEAPDTLQKRTDLPRELKSLAELIDDLLKREPDQRPSDDEIADRLGVQLESTQDDSPSNRSWTNDSRSDDSAGACDGSPMSSAGDDAETSLIGRKLQIEQLEQTFDKFAEAAEPQVAFITGRSGEGKTSLANVFLDSIRRRSRRLLLSGRCYDRESVPFKAIDCWIDPLVSHLRAQPQNELSKWLPKDILMLAHLFPVLRRVPVIAQQAGQNIETQDTRQVRHRAFAALRDLLAAISREAPVILFIDDLQWADGDSAKALRDVLQPPQAPKVILLGTYRSDEAADSPFLKEWADYTAMNDQVLSQQTIEVGPLSEDQCRQLMAERLGMAPDALHEQACQLFSDTLGNPYFLEQILEGSDPESGKIEAVPLAELIERRFQRLPSEARSLLTAISVAGQAVALQEAAVIADQSASAMSTVTHMRNERLVRLIRSGRESMVDTYHDKIRETVLSELPDSERRRLHGAFAEQLLSPPDQTHAASESPAGASEVHPRVFDLAFHLLEADDSRAFHYQLAAGEKAQKEYAMKTALEYLQHAERLLPGNTDGSTQFRLLFSMAEANRGLEQFVAARQYYERAIPLAPDPITAARCEFGIGSGLVRQGQMREARLNLSRALELLGEKLPLTISQQLLTLAKSFLEIHLVPTGILRLFRRGELEAANEMLLFEILSTSNYAFQDTVVAQACTVARTGVVGKLSRDPHTRAFTLGHYALMFSVHGLARLAQHYFRRVDRASEESMSTMTQAHVTQSAGMNFFFLGQLDKAEEAFQECIPQLRRARDFQAGMSFHWLRHVASVRGDATEIERFSTEELRFGEATNDSITVAYAEYGLADALSRKGNCSEATRLASQSIERLRSTGLITIHIAQQELARAQLQASYYAVAAKTLRIATGSILRGLMLQEYFVDSFSLQVEAVLGADWPNHELTFLSRNAGEPRRAQRLARRARWICGRFPTLRPHAYRVSGRAAVASGRPRRAFKFFDEALRSAERVGARYELARTLIDKSWLDYKESADDRARGLSLLKELHCVLPTAESEQLRQHQTAVGAATKQLSPTTSTG